MSAKYGHLAQKLFNVPLAITPRKAEIVMAAIGDRFGVTSVFRDGLTPAAWMEDDADPRDTVPYQVIGGIACIPVHGTLVQKLGTMRPYSGMTGYDGIAANLQLALDDDSVRGICLDIDSPGGEVAGCFDLVDMIYAARAQKPIWSILTESAYSAAFAIATGAERIIVPRTGGCGHVGVICMHVDFSEALSDAGLKVTIVTYGEHKADGRPELPLSDSALASLQADVNEMGELFIQTVARNLGMKPSAVRDTQARTYLGVNAVEIGFADAVMSPAEAFDLFRSHVG